MQDFDQPVVDPFLDLLRTLNKLDKEFFKVFFIMYYFNLFPFATFPPFLDFIYLISFLSI
jgi:hypothetical protein